MAQLKSERHSTTWPQHPENAMPWTYPKQSWPLLCALRSPALPTAFAGCAACVEKNMETTVVYWGSVGRMEKKMETTKKKYRGV